jgi:hypothetical protein
VASRRGGWGLTYPLAEATIGFARERGARALEGYPMITPPGKEITWGEVHFGARQVFEDAGFEEISRPTVRRVVMRIDFDKSSRSAYGRWASTAASRAGSVAGPS